MLASVVARVPVLNRLTTSCDNCGLPAFISATEDMPVVCSVGVGDVEKTKVVLCSECSRSLTLGARVDLIADVGMGAAGDAAEDISAEVANNDA